MRTNRTALDLVTRTTLLVVAFLCSSPVSLHAGGPAHSSALTSQEASAPARLAGRLRITQSRAPLWIRAEEAVGADGTVDWRLLGEDARSVYESVAGTSPVPLALVPQMPEMSGVAYEQHPDGEVTSWLRYGPGSLDDPGGHFETLEEVVEAAIGIYVGEVVATAEGFLMGDVGSLLRVETDRAVLPSGEHRAEQEFYVFWPAAKFSIGDLNFWKENVRYPEIPSIGSRLLIVADRRVPFDQERKLILPREEAVWVETPDGKLDVGEKSSLVAGRPASSLDQVVTEIERLLVRISGIGRSAFLSIAGPW